MATPHNPGPAPANLAPNPGMEPVLENNTRIEQHQLEADRYKVAEQLEALRQTQLKKANLELYKSQGVYNGREGNYTQALHDIQAECASIFTEISTIAANSDTGTITALVRERAAGYSHEGVRVVRQAGESETAYKKRQQEKITEEVAYQSVVFGHAANPTSDDKELKARKRQTAGPERSAVTAIIAEQAAERQRDTHDRHRKEFGSLAALTEGIADHLDKEQERRALEVDRLAGVVEQKLAQWNISGKERHAGQEVDVRAELQTLNAFVANNLGNHNPVRELAVGISNRLRVRIEQRGLNADLASGHRNHDVSVTPAKGFRINGGNVIVYEDGSSAREENGTFVRRDPSGREWQPLREDQRVPLGSVTAPNEPLVDTFKRWEAARTPQTTAEAHAAFSENIDLNTVRETTLTEQINTLSQNINAIDQNIQTNDSIITRCDGVINALTGHHLTPDQQTQLHDAQQEKQAAERANITNHAQVIRLNRDRGQAHNHRHGVRTEISRATYWKGFMEANGDMERPEPTPAQSRGRILGRLIGRGTIQQQPDALPREPEMLPNGMVRWDGLTLHGTQADWRISQGGMGAHVDPANPRVLLVFKADGDFSHRVRI